MSQVKFIRSLCFAALCFVASAQASPPTDLHIGHFETQIDYTLSPGNPDAGWAFSISYDVSNDFSTPDGIVRLDPENTVIVAAPEAKITLEQAFQGLGEAGDTLWILPQKNRPGQIFFGWRNVIDAGIFQQSVGGFFGPSNQGNIAVDLIDVSGPAIDAGGQFAMWESKTASGIEVHFNTVDGLDANDRLEPAPIGSHTHYNYGLTEPGNYEITFRASGRLNPWQPQPNQNTSGEETFFFAVPFSSVALGAAELRLALESEPGPAAIHPFSESVEYAHGQVALVTSETTVGDTLYPYAFGFDLVVTNETPEPHRVGLSGSEPVHFPAGLTLSSDPLEIFQVTGPGALYRITDTANRHFFTFSEAGIYRVELRSVGDESGTIVHGPSFSLTFLAGLDADYDFDAYADSFERTHNLDVGSLKEDGSDWDGDGIPDVIEFQLFWEGFDPAVADADQLPRPDPNDPDGLIIFHRDTYKDRLNRNTQNIVLEYSADFSDWIGWSDRIKGLPLGLYEVSAEKGNAYARIQRRTLRLPSSVPDSAFFRWRIDP